VDDKGEVETSLTWMRCEVNDRGIAIYCEPVKEGGESRSFAALRMTSVRWMTNLEWDEKSEMGREV